MGKGIEGIYNSAYVDGTFDSGELTRRREICQNCRSENEKLKMSTRV